MLTVPREPAPFAGIASKSPQSSLPMESSMSTLLFIFLDGCHCPFKLLLGGASCNSNSACFYNSPQPTTKHLDTCVHCGQMGGSMDACVHA